MSGFYPNMGNMSPSRVRAAMIERDALLLREQGYSYDEIAEQIGRDRKIAFTREQASRAVRRALKQAKAEARENAGQILDIELQRLDRLFQFAMREARAGDLNAITKCLQIMERRTKYLGLDSAIKAEIQTGPAEIDFASLSDEQLAQLERLVTEASEAPEDDSDIQGEEDYGYSPE